jgi:hypothetical protein
VEAGTPSWIERLPAAENTAEKAPRFARGDKVWASTPIGTSEMADVAIFTVDGVYDGLYSLTSHTAQRIDGVHPALVHAAPPLPPLRSDSVVLFYTPSTPAFLGKVDEVVGGASIKVRYDQGGTTKTTEASHVQTPVTGLLPLAYVGFPKAGAMSRGLVIAAVDDQVWIRTGSGHVEVHDMGRVESLRLPPERIGVGTAVEAFDWASGYQHGVVTRVVEDGLRFAVRRDSNSVATYFFSSLVAAK